MLPRLKSKIPSIDLSYIEHQGSNVRNSVADESYVSRIGETTNEDFKEIL